MSKRDRVFLLVAAVIAVLLIFGLRWVEMVYIVPNAYQTQKPVVTEVANTPVSTATPMPTTMPVPTLEPTVTPMPTITPVPTSEPTITTMPTITPVPTITPMPTITPTPVVTPMPTITPTPTLEAVTTTTPTATPVPTTEPTPNLTGYYNQLEFEAKSLVMMNGVYPDYVSEPKYDLYDYIQTERLDARRVFYILSEPIEEGVIIWLDTSFTLTNGNTPESALRKALESSICQDCGRVRIKYRPENQNKFKYVFEMIVSAGKCEEGSNILLDFLYRYTNKNENNLHERLILSCKCKK